MKDTKNGNAVKLVSRVVHVVLTMVILVALMGTNTVLNEHIMSGQFGLPVLFSIFTFISLVLYFIVSFMDPGYVKRTDPDVKEITLVLDDSDEEVELYETKASQYQQHDNQNFSSDEGERESMLPRNDSNGNRKKTSPTRFNLEPHQRCGFCGLERPLRARHCRECKRCVRKFDHHCPWVANCVGERNHRWFWTFLTYELILIAMSIYISTTGYSRSTGSGEWIHNNILLLLIDIVLVIFLFVVGSLFAIHTYMVFSNHTTWESMSKHRITYLQKLEIDNPFNLGFCRNAYVFFCYCKPYNWRTIYKKKVGETDDPEIGTSHTRDVMYTDNTSKPDSNPM